jgi:hypothetical protein
MDKDFTRTNEKESKIDDKLEESFQRVSGAMS